MKCKNFLFVLIITVFSFTCAAEADSNISGKWIMDVRLEAGSGTPSFALTQEGETITGTYTGLFGEAPVTGTIRDNNIELNIKVAAMGQEIVMLYTGILKEDGGIKGTVKMGQFGEGTFTGEKKE
jgi:hypothetical protein